MNDLEGRLRKQLPALADAVATGGGVEAGTPGGRLAAGERRHRRHPSGSAWVVAAAVCAIVLGGLWWLSGRDSGQMVALRTAGVGASGPGEWRAIEASPIEQRSFPTVAWLGDRVIVWAGSNADRSFAYTDGAVYDPAADAWSSFVGPGWGHPGAVHAVYDGRLVVVAKGGGAIYDPAYGRWSSLPQIEGMWITGVVATDAGLWVVGPPEFAPGERPGLMIARWNEASEDWSIGGALESDRFDGSLLGEGVLWTGTEIVVWSPEGNGAAFDPVRQRWREFSAPTAERSRVLASRAVATDRGVVVVQTEATGDAEVVRAALLSSGRWSALSPVPGDVDVETLDLVAAGDHVVALHQTGPPLELDLRTGAWVQHDGSVIGAVADAGATWTGTELIVWGGKLDGGGARGAAHRWTPAS